MTRRTTFWFVFFVITLGEVSAFPLPPPLETGHLLGKGLPSGVPPVPLTDELYALGWSRSNQFAFLERKTVPHEAAVVVFQVLDLVEDKILYRKEWPDWGDPENQQSWWAAREEETSEVFSRYKLIPTQWQMGLFPLILDNEFYTPALRIGRSPKDSLWISSLEVVVHSTGRGIKVVKDSQGYWRWATLLGFIPSPFENRVALILLVQPAGWSRELQPLRFVIVGLSLKAGFPTP